VLRAAADLRPRAAPGARRDRGRRRHHDRPRHRRGVRALAALARLARRESPRGSGFGSADLRPDPAQLGAIARLAGSATLQNAVNTVSWVFLVRVVAVFGATALAGYTVAIRLVIFALLPAWGLSNAAATLVGQSLGAGDPRRAERAVWTTGWYNAAFLGAVGLVFLLAAPTLVGVFTPDAEVARVAARCLRIVSSGFVFYAFGMVLTAAFNGAGDTRTPTVLNLAVFWAFEIPLAWVLARPSGGGRRRVRGGAVCFSTLAVASAVVVPAAGAWKTRSV
jgi:Na+-driven multidrug efflux pump